MDFCSINTSFNEYSSSDSSVMKEPIGARNYAAICILKEHMPNEIKPGGS
jgi:hypothetical protein